MAKRTLRKKLETSTKMLAGEDFEVVTLSMLLLGQTLAPKQLDPEMLGQLQSEPPKSRNCPGHGRVLVVVMYSHSLPSVTPKKKMANPKQECPGWGYCTLMI